MVKHIVLFKLKDKEADAQRAVDALIAMRGKIEGMKDIIAGTDFLMSGRSYDVGLICTFIDKAALEAYQSDPVHLPVKKLMAEIRETSVSCDFEF